MTVRSDCPGCNLLSSQVLRNNVSFYGVKPAVFGVKPAVTGQASCYGVKPAVTGQAILQGQASSHRLKSTTAAAKSLSPKTAVSGAAAGCAAAF